MHSRFGVSKVVAGVTLVFAIWPTYSQEITISATNRGAVDWTLSTTFEDELIGQGVPVLALSRADWPNYQSSQPGTAKAWRSMQAEIAATNSVGWRLATIARAQAWLLASSDAVTLAALDANSADPANPGQFSVRVNSQNWQGEGLKIGSPWATLIQTGQWQWQLDTQFLRLRRLRTNALSGDLFYQGSGGYEFDFSGERSGNRITSPFLAASKSSGLGVSMSVALQGRPAPGWRISVRADDLMSRLQWSNLATEASTLNSQVTSRAPDGSLDYAPLIQGQNALKTVKRRIGAYWQTQIAWAPFEGAGQSSTATYRLARKAGINQNWLGWDSGDLDSKALRWTFEVEPNRSAMQLNLTWRGVHVLVASDGKGLSTEYRRLQFGWTTPL